MFSHSGPDKNRVTLINSLVVLEVQYIRLQVTLVFTADDVENDLSFCKLDADIKNRTAVAGSVGFVTLK